MSFHVNADELRVEEGHFLRGKLPNEDGDLVEAEVDLDEFIGNEDGTSRPASISATSMQYSWQLTYLCLKTWIGEFQWGGENFSHSTDNVSFDLLGDEEEQVPILHAELSKLDEESVAQDINLAERIANINGEFVFN